MESDNETSRTSSKLKNREEFTGWKQEVMLVCMSKGDTEGIFTDAGTDNQVGYQAFERSTAPERKTVEMSGTNSRRSSSARSAA